MEAEALPESCQDIRNLLHEYTVQETWTVIVDDMLVSWGDEEAGFHSEEMEIAIPAIRKWSKPQLNWGA